MGMACTNFVVVMNSNLFKVTGSLKCTFMHRSERMVPKGGVHALSVCVCVLNCLAFFGC